MGVDSEVFAFGVVASGSAKNKTTRCRGFEKLKGFETPLLVVRDLIWASDDVQLF